MVIKFLPKTGGALAAGGAFGGGGVFLYNYTSAKDLKEALVREGFVFIEDIQDSAKRDNAYKAVFVDHQSVIKDVITTITANDEADEAHSKIQTWCSNTLSKPYPLSDWRAYKEKLIKYCANIKPIKVEALLKRWEQTGWIKDTSPSDDEQYKVIFAIYKYELKFLHAIDTVKGEGEVDYNYSTEASIGYFRLKKWCETNLSKSTDTVKDPDLYSYITWWCKPLGYTTVEDRIKVIHTTWEKENSDDTSDQGAWKKIREYWKWTSRVFKLVDPDTKDFADGKNIQPDKYKSWCEATLKKKLYEKYVYQKEYLMAKSVCVKEGIQNKLSVTKNIDQAIKKWKDSSKPQP